MSGEQIFFLFHVAERIVERDLLLPFEDGDVDAAKAAVLSLLHSINT